jgi:LysR family cys regulon transcriptional activator
MNLQQFRYLSALAEHDLNVTRAAARLHTSQPGISKQLRLLEQELGIELFQRHGKHLVAFTAAGQVVLEQARSILQRVEGIRRSAADARDGSQGRLALATTHTQSRYRLPPVISRFVERYPDVELQMQQGTPQQVAELVARGEADLGIATEALDDYPGLVTLPCFRWNHAVLVAQDHPLAKRRSPLTLEALARWPLVTYVQGFTGRSRVDLAFERRGLQPRVVITAADSDVIKTYVRLGMGVGLIASMAVEPERDSDLVALDASQLFEWSSTSIAFQRETALRSYMYDFVALFAPQLQRSLVDRLITAEGSQRRSLLAGLELPQLQLPV